MKLWHLAVMAACLGAGPAYAQGAAPAIIDALDSYNAMAVAVPPLSMARANEFEGSAMLPAWLADIPLTHQEAAALLAAVSTYRMDPDMGGQSRIVTTSAPAQTHHGLLHNVLSGAAQVAGTFAVVGAAEANHAHQPGYSVPDNYISNALSASGTSSTDATSVRYVPASFPTRASRYAYLLQVMGSCRGALTSALDKMTAGHGDTTFVSDIQGLYMENAGMHAPANPECLRGN